MADYLGSFNTSSTRTHVGFQFSTHAAAGGNVAPLSGFEAADLRIYKATDGAAFSATQRSSSNGITMTSPFDSLTGFHDVDIDLTDNSDAGFYAAGCRYSVVLAPDTETIDSQTITGLVLARFDIGPPQVNAVQLGGTTQTGRDIGASVLLSNGTGAGQVSLSSGTVTVGTNNDKTGYSLSQVFPTNFAALGIGATGHITLVDTVTTYTGNTPQTGDLYTAMTGVNSELSAVPAATASILSMIKWMFMLMRNKRTQTSTTELVKANDGSTTVGTATKSDDGTTFTRGVFS